MGFWRQLIIRDKRRDRISTSSLPFAKTNGKIQIKLRRGGWDWTRPSNKETGGKSSWNRDKQQDEEEVLAREDAEDWILC